MFQARNAFVVALRECRLKFVIYLRPAPVYWKSQVTCPRTASYRSSRQPVRLCSWSFRRSAQASWLHLFSTLLDPFRCLPQESPESILLFQSGRSPWPFLRITTQTKDSQARLLRKWVDAMRIIALIYFFVRILMFQILLFLSSLNSFSGWLREQHPDHDGSTGRNPPANWNLVLKPQSGVANKKDTHNPKPTTMFEGFYEAFLLLPSGVIFGSVISWTTH